MLCAYENVVIATPMFEYQHEYNTMLSTREGFWIYREWTLGNPMFSALENAEIWTPEVKYQLDYVTE